ncbi:MAG: molybdopterin-dependent oxidoreductase [Vicinamibacterales bacterium]
MARRRFLRQVAAVAPLGVALSPAARLLAAEACDEGPLGELIAELPLYGVGSTPAPLGRIVGGSGLDARLFTDLSRLAPDRLVTSIDEMFVRTAAPPRLANPPAEWRIALGDGDGGSLTAAALAASARPMGPHLIECAGNSNPQHFGLLSAVEWDGVPLTDVVARMTRPAGATAVLVVGIDDEGPSTRSVPGASWILPAADLDQLGAFLAVGINGRPLTPDHGAPVRLVVPGWYGCAWIKWVTAIRWVGSDEPSTAQMLEYAVRTQQDGRPALARDYAAPVIDTAATPIRVEQRRVDGRIEYRVVGIVWGGTRPVDRLVIRFGPRDPGTPFAVCPAPRTHRIWSLWSYRWRPDAPGYYDIGLRVADPSVPTRRLDLSYYVRRVRIDEV